jgi:hypothetical protein
LRAGRALLLAGLLLAFASAGCSFLLGVSEDPVLDALDAPDAPDATDEDAEDAAPE